MKNLREIMTSASYEPRTGLAAAIWNHLAARINRRRVVAIWSFSIMGVAALAVLVPVLKTLFSELSKSGFYDYASLLFSGSGIVSYWKDFMASLADSLPTVSIFYTLGLVLIFIISVKYALRQFAIDRLSLPHQA